MALLSLEKIREIQDVAELYAARERERIARVDAAARERAHAAGQNRRGAFSPRN